MPTFRDNKHCYHSGETELARERFNMAKKGLSVDDFMVWLGFRFPTSDYYNPMPPFELTDSTMNKKMEMCLSPHWYALIRASIIGEQT